VSPVRWTENPHSAKQSKPDFLLFSAWSWSYKGNCWQTPAVLTSSTLNYGVFLPNGAWLLKKAPVGLCSAGQARRHNNKVYLREPALPNCTKSPWVVWEAWLQFRKAWELSRAVWSQVWQVWSRNKREVSQEWERIWQRELQGPRTWKEHEVAIVLSFSIISFLQ
jgi:hypothetical protein